MRWFTGLAVLCAALYIAIGIVIYSQQSRFIYPSPDMITPVTAGFEKAVLTTADEIQLRSFYRPAAPDMPTAVYFHGNGGTLYGSVVATKQLAMEGYGLLLVEYRGYGGNEGAPSEAGLYADGRAALAFLANKGVPYEQTIIMGNSIGAGIATQLATEVTPKALILTAPFTSLPDVAARIIWWLPTRPLIHDIYDNKAKIGKVDAPILIMHGTADDLIPPAQGKALASENPKAEFQLFEGEGHNLIFIPATQSAQVEWLAGL